MKNGDHITKSEALEGRSESPFREMDQHVKIDLRWQVLQHLLYYDIFSYPLSEEEIKNHLQQDWTSEAVRLMLGDLVDKGWLFKHQDFFALDDDPAKAEERLIRMERSKKYTRIAFRMGKLIAAFPFVQGVYVSGSLSKKWVNEDGDIDYFIITQSGRLWIARTLLVLFKKLFLFNSHKYFCVNYFIDEDHLEIEEKNRFTATEIVTLLPIAGKEQFSAFRAANTWVGDYFPNYPEPNLTKVKKIPKAGLGKLLQWPLKGKLGDWLDKRFLLMTLSVWKRKFKSLDLDHFEVALKSRKYVSKHHPNHFQRRVLDTYHEKCQNFEQKHQLAVGTLSEIG
ncbi:MAG: nucleotidyltransferase domain-containing protein [Bacteroidota bacterium]